ncbi:hypothetical protein HNP84_007325 [Thermocatellispora tengchongensis]|uniref:Uncharacterized protein n=1 Tax=Thermocatellispora tengchongensis TaxID=1073253 RepID=A0A840PI48_9ACTN|nr:hypothetical protein [Thermocatellispora tengchongensis]MBB5137573.1 hypothetical protein [Thermocatellispora tengchongensis]
MAEDMIRFRNITDQDLHLDHREGRVVRAGEVAIVDDAELAEDLADAYIVRQRGALRAWPKVTWELLGAPAPAPKKKGGGE